MTADEVAFKTKELKEIIEAEKKADRCCLIDQTATDLRKDGRRKGEQHQKGLGSTRIVATELGVSPATVAERLKITTLTQDVLDSSRILAPYHK